MSITGKKRFYRDGQEGFLGLTADGFTLLEILLAFFIFAILFVTIYTSYSGSFKTINGTENRMKLYRKAAIVLERISDDLRGGFISNTEQNPAGESADYTHFLGDDATINGNDADTLSFFSLIPPLFSKEGETYSGQLISYSVIQGSRDNELVLLRSEHPEFMDETETQAGLVLADGLQAINFTYFDDDGVEHTNWDSENIEFRGRLPRRVMIGLTFQNEENPDMPFQVMTSVALLVNHVQEPVNQQ